MNLFLENVNLSSRSGPNSFANKLKKYLELQECTIVDSLDDADAKICFIESHSEKWDIPTVQRLDGIYFNSEQKFQLQNENIKRTYELSDGVVFQSAFNRDLVFKYFGTHDNFEIIHNGADTELIENIKPFDHPVLSKYDNVWSCASSWRPHKRLKDNISYFMEHKGPSDCLIIAGNANAGQTTVDDVFYVGNIKPEQLISVYKRCKYFLHLAWLDHCPNVVADARASGCQIICSSTGGTKEIAGPDAVIIEEEEWDFEPIRLYSPPPINFNKKIKNLHNVDYNMTNVASRYKNFLGKFLDEDIHTKGK